MADFRPESLDAAQEILSDLKAKAKAAQEANDVFTFSVLNDLIKTVSPIVTKAFMRLQRAENAKINKAHKELRAKAREETESQPRPTLRRE
jgi:hypothetical protein